VNQKLALLVVAQGSMTSANKAKTYPNYDVIHKKKKQSYFLIIQSRKCGTSI